MTETKKKKVYSERFHELIQQIRSLHVVFRLEENKYRMTKKKEFVALMQELDVVISKLREAFPNTETNVNTIHSTLDKMNGFHDRDDYNIILKECEKIENKLSEKPPEPPIPPINTTTGSNKRKDKTKIFIVHGHDTDIRNEVELFIRRLGFYPVILSKETDVGETIYQKFKRYSNVSFAIILYTACDEGREKGTDEFKARARQNVVFEHGFFAAKLGLKHVVALHQEGVELPGDLAGVLYISLGDLDWKDQLKKRLRNSGFDTDWTLT